MGLRRWAAWFGALCVVACGASTRHDAPQGDDGGTGETGGTDAHAGASAKGGASGATGGSGAAAGRGGTGGNAGNGSAGRGGGSAGRGGTGPSAGTGGESGEPSAAAGSQGDAGAPSPGCSGPVTTTERKFAKHARSAGFSGTQAEYIELYGIACTDDPECKTACMERGGTDEMCSDTLCAMSAPSSCLPTPIWTSLNTLGAEGMTPVTDGAELVLWTYPYHDTLVLDQFALEVPAGAEVAGITATIRRAGGSENEAADVAVRLIKAGTISGADRASPTPWSAPDFADVDYGGEADTWGQAWTAEDLNSDDFGVALSVGYTQSAGSGRAYVDIVYVSVSYRQCR